MQLVMPCLQIRQCRGMVRPELLDLRTSSFELRCMRRNGLLCCSELRLKLSDLLSVGLG